MLYLAVYTALVAGIALGMRHFRPAWGRSRITFLAALPGPLLLLLAGAAFAFIVLVGSDGSTDAGGMAMVAVLMVASGSAFAALVVGMAASSVAMWLSGRDVPTQ